MGRILRPASRGVQADGIEGFEIADKPVTRRLICSAESAEKSGKTHFALTMPGEIAYQNLDVGLDGVIQKFQSDKRIWISNYRFALPSYNQTEQDRKNTSTNCRTLVERFKDDYKRALDRAKVRGIVWDTATEIWEAIRLAHFGKLLQVKPHHYSEPNAEMRELLRWAYDSDKNFCFLHKLKDQYINDKRTGKLERQGFKDMGYTVQVVIRMIKDRSKPAPDCFYFEVTDCRQNPAIENLAFDYPENNFPMLAAHVYDSELEEWQ